MLPRVPKTPAAQRLQLLDKLRRDIKWVEDFFVRQRKGLKVGADKELDLLRTLYELIKVREQCYASQASQLQRVAKRSKPAEKRKGKKANPDNNKSLSHILLSALVSQTEQEARTMECLAKDCEYVSRLVKDRIDALGTIYTKCDDGATTLHVEVRGVIDKFQEMQGDYLASSEQLEVGSSGRSQLTDNLIQGRVPPEETEEEAQEKLAEKGVVVAQFQRRSDVSLESCFCAAAAANTAVEKLGENLAELMSCFELGEEGWLAAILNRLESSDKKLAASVRKEMQGGKNGGSGKDGRQQGAGDWKKDASITSRHHFHVRRMRFDTLKADFGRLTGAGYDHEIGVLRSDQETKKHEMSKLATEINNLWSSGVMFKRGAEEKDGGNEQLGLIPSDLLRPQRLLRRWKAKRGPGPRVGSQADDGQSNIGKKQEMEDQQEQQPSVNEECGAKPLRPSRPATATAPPEELVGCVVSLDMKVNNYLEYVTEHVLGGNHLARLEARNALLPKAPTAGGSSNYVAQNQPPFTGTSESENVGPGPLPQNFSSAQTENCGQGEGEGEFNEDGGGDGETGEHAPTPTHQVEEEGNLLSCSIKKAERGFGFVFDWADNAVRVKGVKPDGPASHMLSIGDKIICANGKRLSDLGETRKLFRELPTGGKLELHYCKVANAKPDSAGWRDVRSADTAENCDADGDAPKNERTATSDASPDNAES